MKKYVEYTQLQNMNRKEMKSIIEFANKNKPRALVIESGWASLVRRELNKEIKVVTVGGYPFQNIDTALDNSIADIDEFDMVIPLQAYYKNSNLYKVFEEIKSVKKKLRKKKLKVIIETTFMYDKRYAITELVKCIEDSGGDIVKTNTGRFNFQFKDASRKGIRVFDDLLEDVDIIKSATDLPIKAAGGIRTKEQAQQIIDLGVSYIGTSGNFWI